MRVMGRRLGVLAAVVLAVAGLSCTIPASAAVHQAAGANAATRQAQPTKVPHTKKAWQAAIAHVRAPGHGCYQASYPALAWHAAKCSTGPRWPVAPQPPSRAARPATPATVGAGADYTGEFTTGLISQAIGTFDGIAGSEQGQVGGSGPDNVPNAFSLQMNSQDFASPACAASSNSAHCQAWQQFLYQYVNSTTSQVLIQYWLLGYLGSSTTACPSGWTAYPTKNPVDCYTNSLMANVSTLAASNLPNVQLSGVAMSGGDDAVTLSVAGGQATTVSASDSVLDLSAQWSTTEWNVFGQCCSAEADFTSSTSLVALTSFAASTGPVAPTCVANDGTTAETNNLTLSSTPVLGSFSLPTMAINEVFPASGTGKCASTPAARPSPAGGLAADPLTSTWQAQSDLDSTGSPQPLPNTTAGCGNWSGADGTQVVSLGNGDNLWSFGDTFLGPAVARQDFFNNGFIRNSMVLQDGSAFTTITGGTGCASGQPTTATAPITASGGGVIWPSSSIVYGSDVEKFYSTVNSGLVQQQPQVAEIPQSDLESGSTFSQQALALNSCTANPIMWGAATVSSGGYTYIYGSQQYSAAGGDTGGNGGELYLARAVGDPSDQGSWEYYTTSGWSQEGAACGGPRWPRSAATILSTCRPRSP